MTDHFAHKAADWDQPSKIQMTDKFVEELMLNLELNPDWNGLEIGAGTGLVGLKLLPYLKAVVFEDTSAAMLDVLKSKLQGDEAVEIVQGEVFEYQQQDIDLVFSCMAFHHIPDIEKALAHLASITNQHAYIVIGDLISEDGSFHRFEPIPHQGFDLKELSGKFKAAGFEVKSTYIYDTLERERIEGKMSEYEQFILIAQKK
jgi:SAM-dependent methyltransferase